AAAPAAAGAGPGSPCDGRLLDRTSAAAAARKRRRRGSRLELRNVVAAVRARVQAAHADDCAEIEFTIEMREQLVLARRLPAQPVAQRVGVDFDQEQAALAEEMLASGRCDLRGGREVNIAVPEIVGAAAVHPLPLGFAPGRGGANFVDPAHAFGDPACGLSLLGFSRIFRTAPRPYRRHRRTSRAGVGSGAAWRKPLD